MEETDNKGRLYNKAIITDDVALEWHLTVIANGVYVIDATDGNSSSV